MKIIEFFQQHLALAISAAFGLIGILHFSVVIGEITPLIIIGEPVDPREPYLSESSQTKLFLGDAVIAAWRTELNPQSLVGLELAGLPMTTALSRDTPPRLSGQVVAVDLPGGLDGLQLHVDTIWEHSNGGITYAGRIEAEVAWLFTLTIEKSTILGRLHLDDRLFLLHSSSESQLILYEIDISRIPQSQHIYEDADAAQGTSLLSSSPDPIPCSGYSPNNDNGNVRVLFLYSPNISSGITTLINNIVAQFNQSAINSGVDIKNYLTVANTRQISSNLDGLCRGGIEDSEDGVINRMRLGNSPFSNLTQWMSNDHADIAFTILEEDLDAEDGENCFVTTAGNYGRIGGVADGLLKDPHAMSTISFAMGDLTAPHEIGHVLGGLHQNVNPSNLGEFVGEDGVPDCARGWIESNSWFTVMGTYTGSGTCVFDPETPPDQQQCHRIPLWSNPDTQYQGKSTGDQDDHNVALAFNITMPMVADWTSFPNSTPGVPSNVSANSTCFWLNDVTWSSVTHADTYQLVFSTTSNFSSQSLIYSGPGTWASHLGPGYFRVRACNGSGCGSWSSSVSAEYFDGCL